MSGWRQPDREISRKSSLASDLLMPTRDKGAQLKQVVCVHNILEYKNSPPLKDVNFSKDLRNFVFANTHAQWARCSWRDMFDLLDNI